MVLSNNAYGTRGRGVIPVTVLCVASATMIALVAVGLAREYQELEKRVPR